MLRRRFTILEKSSETEKFREFPYIPHLNLLDFYFWEHQRVKSMVTNPQALMLTGTELSLKTQITKDLRDFQT